METVRKIKFLKGKVIVVEKKIKKSSKPKEDIVSQYKEILKGRRE